MNVLIFIPLLFTVVFSKYLDGLNRSFDEVESTMIDMYVTLPPSELNRLIKLTQISTAQVKNGASKLEDFEYENAQMVIKWNGNEKVYEKVNFKTGGMYGRSNDKVGFNIKLDKKFLERKNLRLRPDASDRSHLRSKLSCDIANRMGVPSIQAAYARLYMNNEFWGLYTLMDAVKTSWVKQTFKPSEKEITNLFQCKNGGFNFKPNSYYACINANDDYPDKTAFKEFVAQVNAANSVSEIEKIMDVEVFLKYLAMEWLIGSFDHFMVYGHNFNFYKRESDNKWVIIYYDYDNTFGNGLTSSNWADKGPNQDGSISNRGDKPIEYSFSDWEKNIPIINTLVHKNKEQFKRIVREVLVSAFNPEILNEHIDSLKTFLTPYIKEDSVVNKNGILPGRINRAGSKQSSSVYEFEKNIQFSLKSWISTKFDVACKNYGFDKNEILYESSKYVPKPYNYGSSSKPNKSPVNAPANTPVNAPVNTPAPAPVNTQAPAPVHTPVPVNNPVRTPVNAPINKPVTTKPTTTTTIFRPVNNPPSTTAKTVISTKTVIRTTTVYVPKSTTTTAATIPTPETENTEPSSQNCTSITEAYQPCGGINYPDASPCCEEGYVCKVYNDYFSMCTPQ